MASDTIINDILAGKDSPVLKLANIKVTPEELEKITGLAASTGEYSSLNLSNCGLTPQHIAKIKGKWTGIKADNNPLLGAEGGKLLSLMGLTDCDISYSNAGGQLSGFKTGPLKRLKMRGGTATGMTISDVTQLMTNPNFTQLNLSGNALNFGNAGCKIVCANTRLEVLNLRGCGGMDDSAALLSRNGNLRVLDVSNWRDLTDAGIRSIGEIGTLTHLTMIGMPRSCSMAVVLNKNITHLDLNFNFALGHAGFAAFATPDRFSKFESLNLFGCNLTNASVDLMLQMPNLINVNVEENPIDFAKKQQLEAHIKNNRARIFGTSANVVSEKLANPTPYTGTKFADPVSHAVKEEVKPMGVMDIHFRKIQHANGKAGFWGPFAKELAQTASRFNQDHDNIHDLHDDFRFNQKQ